MIYFYALRTRKLAGLITRKLSVTESQKVAQFFGTSSRRKWSNGITEVVVGRVAPIVCHVFMHQALKHPLIFGGLE
jgi:hypothetical protein